MRSLLQNFRGQNNQLTLVWLSLMALTLFSTLIAEQKTTGVLMVLFICSSFAIKGSLVTEKLMGLYAAKGSVRWLMLAYFIVLPVLIGLAILFPDLVEKITTL